MHRSNPAGSRSVIAHTGMAGGLAVLALILAACGAPDNGPAEHAPQNPLLAEIPREPSMPPLSDFSVEHFEPAFDSALDEHRGAVRTIAGNPEPPSFENTVAALENAERALDRLTRLLYGLHAVAATADTHRLVAQLPDRLSEHFRRVYRDRRLYERLGDLARGHSDLPAWQARLTALSLRRLRHHGAGLSRTDRRMLDRLDERMQSLGERFIDNLAPTDSTPARLDSETDAVPGRSSIQSRPVDSRAVLSQHDDRSRRRQAWQARRLPDDTGRANETLIRRINRLRHRHAQLLGYPSHAAYLFAGSEAGGPETAAEWLQLLARQLRPGIRSETRRLAARLTADGETAPAQPWDWRFYQASANPDPTGDTTRARFPLEAVRRGAFELAETLFGLRFRERPDIAAYHSDVRVFQVVDPARDHPGILLMDDFSRPGKRSGAWTSRYTWSPEGPPVVATVTGFEPPQPGSPVLLTADQTQALFHEFGHAMQILLSHGRYPSLNGSALPADGIEFPAALFERFALHPEMLAHYADAIDHNLPDIPSDHVSTARDFPALALSQSVIAAWLDLGWRQAAAEDIVDIDAFEARMLASLGLPSISHPPYRSRHLARVFADTGRAGHYRHLLADLLAADVYARFEPGLFDPRLGAALKRDIFQPGNTRPVLAGFEVFMGRPLRTETFLSERVGDKRPLAGAGQR